MDLRNLSDDALEESTLAAVGVETDATLFVLHHIREIERRQLYAVRHRSLFEYVVKKMRYDSGSANLRIAAMRLLRELPEFEEKLESGSLNLTLLAQAQSFICKERVKGPEAKREVLDAIVGMSTRDAQRELLGRAKSPEKHRPEKVRPLSKTHSEIKFVVDNEFLARLREVQAMIAHSHPGAGLREVIEVAVKGEIARRTPRAPRKPAKDSGNSAHDGAAQPIQSKPLGKAEIRRIVRRRDKNQCGFVVDIKTGRKCCSQYALQFDHVIPKARGGQYTVENLRLRCRTHNRLEAIRIFGHEKMAEFVGSMR